MFNEIRLKTLRRATAAALCASALLLASGSAQAQSDASVGVSMLPVASVVSTAVVSGAAISAEADSVAAFPVALALSGAELTVKALEASARGTVIVLERVSDGAAASIEMSTEVAGRVALKVGASVVTTVITSGVILSVAGELLCFIPNAVGQALLYNERVQ